MVGRMMESDTIMSCSADERESSTKAGPLELKGVGVGPVELLEVEAGVPEVLGAAAGLLEPEDVGAGLVGLLASSPARSSS